MRTPPHVGLVTRTESIILQDAAPPLLDGFRPGLFVSSSEAPESDLGSTTVSGMLSILLQMLQTQAGQVAESSCNAKRPRRDDDGARCGKNRAHAALPFTITL